MAAPARWGRPSTACTGLPPVGGGCRRGYHIPGRRRRKTAWPLRAADIDPAGHVNNSIHWAAVEDVLDGIAAAPAAAEMEYHRPILPGQQPRLVTSHKGGQVGVWLLDGSSQLASAHLIFPG